MACWATVLEPVVSDDVRNAPSRRGARSTAPLPVRTSHTCGENNPEAIDVSVSKRSWRAPVFQGDLEVRGVRGVLVVWFLSLEG
jgi:hypothetical protein